MADTYPRRIRAHTMQNCILFTVTYIRIVVYNIFILVRLFRRSLRWACVIIMLYYVQVIFIIAAARFWYLIYYNYDDKRNINTVKPIVVMLQL